MIYDWPIRRLYTAASLVTAQGARGTVSARNAVICAGPWTKMLLERMGTDLPLS